MKDYLRKTVDYWRFRNRQTKAGSYKNRWERRLGSRSALENRQLGLVYNSMSNEERLKHLNELLKIAKAALEAVEQNQVIFNLTNAERDE